MVELTAHNGLCPGSNPGSSTIVTDAQVRGETSGWRLRAGQTLCGYASALQPGTELVAGDERQPHKPERKRAWTARKARYPARVVLAVIGERGLRPARGIQNKEP